MSAAPITIFVVILIVAGIVAGFIQSRYAKKIGGRTRSVRRAEAISSSPLLQDMVEQHGNPSDAVNYLAAHRIADVVAGSVDQPSHANMDEFDMLDPHYKKPDGPTGAAPATD